MSIAAKGSSGVFARCPSCQAAIQHGFQVCPARGDRISAEQQKELQKALAKSITKFVALGVSACGLLYVASQLLS